MSTYTRLEPGTLAKHTEQYLLNNLGRHVTLEELTAEFGVSGTTLKKHFREDHGMSLYAWFKMADAGGGTGSAFLPGFHSKNCR